MVRSPGAHVAGPVEVEPSSEAFLFYEVQRCLSCDVPLRLATGEQSGRTRRLARPLELGTPVLLATVPCPSSVPG